MITRADIVAELRRWEGTPHKHQASVRGVGCDCKGFVVGVARELGLPEFNHPGVGIANYGRVVDPARLRGMLEAVMIEVPAPQPGDVILINVNRKPRHLAFLTEPGRMIHCLTTGPSKVMEVPIWSQLPIDSYWTWPSLGDCQIEH